MRNFPIDWVVDIDLPGIKKNPTYSGYTIKCPMCHKEGKFDINLEKNVGNCPACGAHGNHIQLHSMLCKISGSEAYADLKRRWRGLPSDVKVKLEQPPVFKKDVPVTPLYVRDKVYREFLGMLSLSDKHREALIKRGLDEPTIEKLMYKDVPEKEMDISEAVKNAKMDKRVADYFKKHRDVRIAGFYDLNTDHPKTVANKSGILLPIIVKNPHHSDDAFNGNATEEENLISGFQIRFDNTEPYTYVDENGEVKQKKPARYMPFYSIQKETGCRFAGYESVHFRIPDSVIDETTFLFERPKADYVIFTEGVLKSDVASHLSEDTPFIGILGVNNQNHLEEACKLLRQRYNTKKVILAFDQDKDDNWRVLEALKRAKEKIESYGLEVSEADWKEDYQKYGSDAKGIDDVLLLRKQRREKS